MTTFSKRVMARARQVGIYLEDRMEERVNVFTVQRDVDLGYNSGTLSDVCRCFNQELAVEFAAVIVRPSRGGWMMLTRDAEQYLKVVEFDNRYRTTRSRTAHSRAEVVSEANDGSLSGMAFCSWVEHEAAKEMSRGFASDDQEFMLNIQGEYIRRTARH